MVKFKRLKTIDSDAKAKLVLLQTVCLPLDEVVFPRDGIWWIGHDNSQPVAFCLLAPSKQWKDTAYLARSGVLQNWRGKGLQKKMILLRERHARKLGYTWIVSDTTDNPPSANSLARKGYQMFEPTKPWGVETSLYWRKKL
jgi:GNAT superfamily N-acetyltransferase